MGTSNRYKWEVLVIVMIGTMMAALDTSIVNVSVPNIMADFGVGVDDIEWIITGYMLSFATLMPLTAYVRERLGHKTLYIGSLIIFVAGSVLCGLAWNLPSLVVARVIQALGGGAITPTGMAMIAEVFEPEERGKAMGYWGVGVVAGPALGPTLGGLLTEVFGWRSIFLVNLPIGLIGLWAAYSLLKADRPKHATHKPFDTWGFIFFSMFLVSFLLGVSKGEHEGWTSNYIITCGFIAVLGFIAFITVEMQVPYRIIDLSLFANPVYSVSVLVTTARSIVLYGGTFLLPLFLQQVQGLSETQSGLIMLPGSALIAVLMPVVGKLGNKVSTRNLVLVGLISIGVFMYMYKDLDVNTSHMGVIYPTLIRGFGLALMIAPVNAMALNSVSKEKAGMASSMLNIMQQVGGSLGIAILSTVLSNRNHFHQTVLAERANLSSPAYSDAFHHTQEFAHSLGYNLHESINVGHSLVTKTLMTDAYVKSFQDAFLVGAGFVAISLVAAFIMLPREKVEITEEMSVME